MRARVPGNGTKSGGGNEGSFNGRFGEDCLNVNWLWNVMDARWKIAAWKKQYQEERPHSSLGYRTPAEFARQMGGENGCGKVKATFPLRLEIPRRA
jgi:putative transposase